MPQFRLDNWSGGKTDNYLNADPKQSQECDNLLVDRNAKLFLRHGSVLDSTDFALTSIGNQRISRIIGFRRRNGAFDYFKVQGRRVTKLTGEGGTGHAEVTGPQERPFFTNGNLTTQINYDEWNDHFIACVADRTGLYARPTLCFHKDDNTIPMAVNCGLPKPKNLSVSSLGSTHVYTYAVHYVYRYNIGDVAFEMRGPIEMIQSESAPIGYDGIGLDLSFAAFPTESLVDNFDIDNIQLRVFRTTADGQVPYHLTDIPATSTSFGDEYIDDDIENGEFVYSTGGVLDYHEAPLAKYVTIVNGIAWYANIKESETSPAKTFRVIQSIPSAPYSTHPSFYVNVEGEITGISRFSSYPLVFTLDRIYRLEGSFTEDGTGFIRARELGSSTGCVGHNSIVRTPDGVYFAGQDGFYLTDGQTVKKISRHLEKTYPQFVRNQTVKDNIQGVFDEMSGRVCWAVSSGANGNENDKVLVLDPYWGVSDTMTFTTLSGGPNWTCTSILFYRDVWYRSSAFGYTYIHSPDVYTDPYEDVGTDAENWSDRAIQYNWTSAAVNFGTDVERKWVTQVLCVFNNETNLSVNPYSCNDASDDFREMKEIRYRGNLTWGQTDFIWGADDFIWRDTGNIIAKRSFPAGTLRCTHKQIKFTNSKTVIIRSDDYAPVIINSVNKTALLTNHPVDLWPSEVIGYFIRLSNDAYGREFEIKSRTDDTLILDDSIGGLQDGNWNWEIVGYRKSEKFILNAATINYEVFGSSHPGFQKSDEGRNA
jgi:hypothetical protein